MRLVVLAALLIVLAVLQIQDSFACSCSAHPDFLMTWIGSDGAFQATVKDIPAGDGPRKVVFDIHQVQKGSYPYGDHIFEDSSIIRYGEGSSRYSSCSVDYKVGETYQVFTYGGNQFTGETGICSTKQISGFDEYSHEDEHGQIQHYRQDYNFFSQYGLSSLTMSVAVPAIIAGVVVWRKRRSDQR